MFKETESIRPENNNDQESKLEIIEGGTQQNKEADFEKECFSENMRDRLFYFLSAKFGSQMNERDIEEITQETLLKAYKARNKYDSQKAELSTWLFIIAKNTALNHLKKLSRQAREQPEEKINQFPEQENSAEDRLAAKEEAVKYLKELSPRRQKILSLHFIEGLSYPEISQVLEVSPKTIGTTITKARQQIRSAREKIDKEIS